MSQKAYYLARAAQVSAMAAHIQDPLTRRSLAQAVESWKLLAETEADADPLLACLWPKAPGFHGEA